MTVCLTKMKTIPLNSYNFKIEQNNSYHKIQWKRPLALFY